METLYITHPSCRLHEMGTWHPESPRRLDAISDQLVASGLMNYLVPCEARLASSEDLLRVHAPEYLDYLCRHAPTQDYFPIDSDTIMNPDTLQAAYAAAGAGLTALDQILSGRARTAFCAIRPPGHHARAAQAIGFCFFNNVAVAARYALDHHGVSRVAIVDFDVHHGNGTEEAFLHEDRVMMCSFYQHPFFPDLHVADLGPNMINVPVEAYSGGDVIRGIVSQQWLPALRRFRPELILVSAGFDAHREDDMGNLRLVEADYAWITDRLVELAEDYAQGRIVSFLEGGYAMSALGRSVVAHVRALGCY
ncbi:MAG: histone deacetylase family protein [Castellaniella sp.]|uniref:histone deacetylase family protein n=1 Tax=Castellaniella sp. TaxID=1955812 RepID=UPI00120829D5|nr:histone deacetylase family protein [Castellaniella sp.]TAN30921.1 MAG: histone deacetylase family protein [Castellaniella sp.]